jgi:hypothetical protein
MGALTSAPVNSEGEVVLQLNEKAKTTLDSIAGNLYQRKMLRTLPSSVGIPGGAFEVTLTKEACEVIVAKIKE